jgi:UTP--glucose-1-phosphate uridylyltransferase
MRYPGDFAARPLRALLPVAGRGARMYPATAAVPKELLPIRTRPLLEFALDEILVAGITEIVLVTARGKGAIEDFLEDWCGRQREDVRVSYVRQPEQRGLGDAVLCAEHLLRDSAFAVVLPDELLVGSDSTLSRLIDAYERLGLAAVSLQSINDAETRSYGVPSIADASDGLYAIDDLVEKPGPARAPSRMGVVGRYVLPPTVFAELRMLASLADREVRLTAALAALARAQGIRGVELKQRRIDCGTPAGFLEAQLSIDAVEPAQSSRTRGADDGPGQRREAGVTPRAGAGRAAIGAAADKG